MNFGRNCSLCLSLLRSQKNAKSQLKLENLIRRWDVEQPRCEQQWVTHRCTSEFAPRHVKFSFSSKPGECSSLPLLCIRNYAAINNSSGSKIKLGLYPHWPCMSPELFLQMVSDLLSYLHSSLDSGIFYLNSSPNPWQPPIERVFAPLCPSDWFISIRQRTNNPRFILTLNTALQGPPERHYINVNPIIIWKRSLFQPEWDLIASLPYK